MRDTHITFSDSLFYQKWPKGECEEKSNVQKVKSQMHILLVSPHGNNLFTGIDPESYRLCLPPAMCGDRLQEPDGTGGCAGFIAGFLNIGCAWANQRIQGFAKWIGTIRRRLSRRVAAKNTCKQACSSLLSKFTSSSSNAGAGFMRFDALVLCS